MDFAPAFSLAAADRLAAAVPAGPFWIEISPGLALLLLLALWLWPRPD